MTSFLFLSRAEELSIDEKITQAITAETIRQIGDSIDSHRYQFQQIYAAVFHSDIATMTHLTSELKDIGTDYLEQYSLLSAKYDNYSITPMNIERTQVGWELMKTIAMEILAVYEERIALSAFIRC